MDSLRVGLFVALFAAILGMGWLCAENARLRAALDAQTAAAPAPAAPARVAPPASGEDRMVSDDARVALVRRLSEVSDPDRQVWFVIDRDNQEAKVYQQELAATFAEAGWPVQKAIPRLRLKPGVFVFIAEETPPRYVTDALEAFQVAGIEVTTGTGYRAYYEERQAEDPSWSGLVLAPDQSWVVVVGRKGE